MKTLITILFLGILAVFPILKAPEVNMPSGVETVIPFSLSGNGIHSLSFDYVKQEADYGGFIEVGNIDANCIEYDTNVHCDVTAPFGQSLPSADIIKLRLTATEDQSIYLVNADFLDQYGHSVLGNVINGYITIISIFNP